MTSFVSFSAEQRIRKENFLLKLNKLLDWEKIRKRLKKLYKKDEEDNGGARPYDPVKMFKAVLLGQWYSLSDPALEEALCVRLDFMMFTGFELLEDCPDETTLCRFRNRLVEKNLDKKLFKEINFQLEHLGLKIREARGAIIDATIIESSARPKKQIEIQEDRKEEKIEYSYQIKESKDPDSHWLKKGKRCFFGYKGFICVDDRNGFINKIKVEPANVAEINNMEELIEGIEAERVYADKGYCSKRNKQILKEKNYRDGIMQKAVKQQGLTKWEKLRNKLISKRRFRVEQCFGTIKRRFNFSRASYLGKAKVRGQFYFKAICYNLLKGIRMIEVS